MRLKLLNSSQSTPSAKDLHEHTLHTFDFPTTVHNMAFDLVKIDLIHLNSISMNTTLGRAYLPLRELQKKVWHLYTRPRDSQSEEDMEEDDILENLNMDTLCTAHDDTIELELPLFKHRSVLKPASSQRRQSAVSPSPSSVVSTSSSLLHSASNKDKRDSTGSFTHQAPQGVPVGTVVVVATLHFKEQDPTHILGSRARQSSRSWPSIRRSLSSASLDSMASSDSSTLGEGSHARPWHHSSPPNSALSSCTLSTPTTSKEGPPPALPQLAPADMKWAATWDAWSLVEGFVDDVEEKDTPLVQTEMEPTVSPSQDHMKQAKSKISLFSKQTRSALKDIQLMYNSFFGHGWNLSRAELLRGFQLVGQYNTLHPTPRTNKPFDDLAVLDRACHFVRLAMATYGSLPWATFGLKVAPLNFVRFHSDRRNVIDFFHLQKEDMIAWHFDKSAALIPSYFIIRDPKTNSLCIVLRGTFSIADAMTDLVCEYSSYQGGLVHKGIMDSARFVLGQSSKEIEAALDKFGLQTIHCIGHSLGGATASLLCSLLQDRFSHYVIPATSRTKQRKLEIKACLFAPPPVCTPDLAQKWEKTQLTFINENDLVCRLCYSSALDLKELTKMAAAEWKNPALSQLSRAEKTNHIMAMIGQAQSGLVSGNDIPRIVVPGSVAFLYKAPGDEGKVEQGKSSHKKEIRVEYSHQRHFMSLPLKSNWLWHHFPQQYDSRLQRATAWAKSRSGGGS